MESQSTGACNERFRLCSRQLGSGRSGDPMSPVYAAKLGEIQSVYNELKQLMKPEEIGSWLRTEMEEFEGRAPEDLISKGETGRLWASLFYLRSGAPDLSHRARPQQKAEMEGVR